MSYYEDIIRQEKNRIGRIDVDERHIEAFMRLQHQTLEHLNVDQFTDSIEIACACIDEGGTAQAESLAKSFGL